MSDPKETTILIERDSVIVTGSGLSNDRTVLLFFTSILGCQRIDQGWHCPLRHLSLSTLVPRINTFLEGRGFVVNRIGAADSEVQREIERKRSFERTRNAALELRNGHPTLDIDLVKQHIQELGWDHSNRRLYPHQEIGVVHGLTAINAANFSVPGAGKTITTLAVAAAHIFNQTIDIVIVVGPLSCFAPWEKETRAALANSLETRRVRGTAEKRQMLYRQVKPRQLILISYATAAVDKSELIVLCKKFRTMLVIDESHRIKRFRGGLWAPSLMAIARYARVKMILSGTPMPQSGRDLFSQLRILWPAGELTGPRDDFALKVDKNFDALLRDVQPFVSRTPKHALGLEPYRVFRHDVELAPTQREIYELIESQFRRRLHDAETWKDKIEALKRGRPIRLLQAAANPDLFNKADNFYHLPRFDLPNPSLLQRLANYRAKEVPAKSKRALELIQDIVQRSDSTGGKTVCWSNFVHNLDQFSELIRSTLGIPVFQIDGRVPAGDQSFDEGLNSNPLDIDNREAIIDRFLRTAGPAVLVTNPASTSESISLHDTCHNAIYLDRTYDCALFLQSIDRIHRLGLRSGQAVEVHLILGLCSGRPTIDQLVEKSLGRKEQRMRQLLEGAELAPLGSKEDPLEAAQGDAEDLSNLLRYLLGEDAAHEGEV